jgi:transposase-like protein
VLDVLVQSRRDKQAAKRLLRKLLKRQGRMPRVLITDKLAGTVNLLAEDRQGWAVASPTRPPRHR